MEYMARCAWIYREARRTSRPVYWGLSRHGVPSYVMLLAHGRAAWQVTQIALDHGFSYGPPK